MVYERSGVLCYTAPRMATAGHRLLLSVLILIIGRLGDSIPYASGLPQGSVPRKPSRPLRFRVDLIHRDWGSGGRHPTAADRARREIERSRKRQLELEEAVSSKGVAAPVHSASSDFLVRVGVGTPPAYYNLTLVTGADLTWMQCQPCADCFKQAVPVFDPAGSSTYAAVPCANTLCQAFAGSACEGPAQCPYSTRIGIIQSKGVLATETFTVGEADSFPAIVFGCGRDNRHRNRASQGVVGMGRGPLSLISQLGPAVESRFSYCLNASAAGGSTPLFFGDWAALGAGSQTVPYEAANARASAYYLPVAGISVGGTLLQVAADALQLQADGTKGVVVDPGSAYAVLDEAAYAPLRAAFESAIGRKPSNASIARSQGLLCYDLAPSEKAIEVPALTFHFKGHVDWQFPPSNYFVQLPNSRLHCLAFVSKSGAGPSVLGSILQRNFQILYDNAQGTFSFVPSSCYSF